MATKSTPKKVPKKVSSKAPKKDSKPWTIADDKATTGYVDRILGIEGGGAKDTAGTHTSETLKSSEDALRGYNKNYGFCSENELAHKWYLDNKSGASKDTEKN